MSSYKLAERAVLMRLSIGCPGEQRQDPNLTSEVKSEHKLGVQSGRWVKSLFPPEALKGIKQLDNEARAYHAAVTLPFDQGIGILPAALIMEYGDRMREFKGRRDNLIESQFLKDPQKWVEWAVLNHNGSFDPNQYPGCHSVHGLYDATEFNADEFRSVMREKFSFRCEPLPVPDAAHFQGTLSSLLGLDAESVNIRVQDAMTEGMRELLKRMIDPVTHMAHKLKGLVCPCRSCKGKAAPSEKFKDTLTENITEIANLVPKLNISADPQIDQFAKDMVALASVEPEKLRKDKTARSKAAMDAQAMLDRLSGYKL